MLNGFGAAWAQIYEPKFRFSIRQNYLPNVTTFSYMRLHGRNAAQWRRHDKSEDRYNYQTAVLSTRGGVAFVGDLNRSIAELRTRPDAKQGIGFKDATLEFEDLAKAGVVDPTKVVLGGSAGPTTVKSRRSTLPILP